MPGLPLRLGLHCKVPSYFGVCVCCWVRAMLIDLCTSCGPIYIPVSSGKPALCCGVAALAQSHYTQRQASAKLGPGS
jgi:hypothetical protein